MIASYLIVQAMANFYKSFYPNKETTVCTIVVSFSISPLWVLAASGLPINEHK